MIDVDVDVAIDVDVTVDVAVHVQVAVDIDAPVHVDAAIEVPAHAGRPVDAGPGHPPRALRPDIRRAGQQSRGDDGPRPKPRRHAHSPVTATGRPAARTA